MARHVHADLIHKWAEGAEIECFAPDGIWTKRETPLWFEGGMYRIAQSEQQPGLYPPKLARMRLSQHSEYFSVAQSGKDAKEIESNPSFIEWVK